MKLQNGGYSCCIANHTTAHTQAALHQWLHLVRECLPEVSTATVGDLCAKQVQRAQAGEGRDVRQTRIRDFPRVEVQRLELRQ